MVTAAAKPEAKTESRNAVVKVRRTDYDAARDTVADLPITFLKLFTAMRIHWERASGKQRMDAIRQVNAVEAAGAAD